MSMIKEFKEFAVKGINAVRRQPATPPPPTTQEKLLMEIRDTLRARN